MLVDVWLVESLALPSNQHTRARSTEISFVIVFFSPEHLTRPIQPLDMTVYPFQYSVTLLINSRVAEPCFSLSVLNDSCMYGFICLQVSLPGPKESVTHKS